MIPPVLPTSVELQPYLDRLSKNSGGIILVAIEAPETQNFHRVTIGVFDAGERKSLRAALSRAKKRRAQKGNHATLI